MASVNIVNTTGAAVGSLELNDAIFDCPPNETVVKEAVVALQANARQGTVKVKGRSEVNHSTAKPFRQKGTGRARQGMTGVPQMRGGGKAHGPQPRSHRQAVPTRLRRQALACALSERVRHGRLSVLRGLEVGETPKTKPFAAMMQALAGRRDEDRGLPHKSLLVTANYNETLLLSARNLEKVVVRTAADVNVLDVLGAARVVVEEDAVAKLEERLS
jgi:large subunit ribosomal protein L4